MNKFQHSHSQIKVAQGNNQKKKRYMRLCPFRCGPSATNYCMVLVLLTKPVQGNITKTKGQRINAGASAASAPLHRHMEA